MSDLGSLKEGERRVVTILFSDMKGFTSLSERMDPEEIDSLMNEVFGKFEEIIHKNGGMVEKYIGDALVAVFGVPDIHEDDPSRAVHSAMEFLEAMKAKAAGLHARGIDASFRTGINSGLITTGKRGEYEVVTGHAMNVAQRLEAAAPPDSILVSETAKEKCENEFEFSKKITLTVKGKKETVVAYEILGRATGEMRDEGPFIGRKDLLDGILKDYIRNSYEEVSGYFLSGDAGMGKTRTALAFTERIRRFPDFATPVLTARPRKYNARPFASIFEIIFEYFDLDPRTERDSITPLIDALPDLPKGTPEKFARVVEGREQTAGEAEILTLFSVFNAILKRHVNDVFPILVFIDNAPTMDRQSREFFQYLFKNGKIKPFFVLTGREYGRETKEAFPGLKLLKLPPFTQEESLLYVKAYWPEAETRDRTTETIVQSAMGNPLFLREYVRYAKENRDSSSLPLTIQNIFLATLDKYPQASRELLKKVSVFQLSFTMEDARYLEEKTGGNPEAVRETLSLFVSAGILKREGEYHVFRLDVFRKALYASILNFNKKILHGLVADMLKLQKKPNFTRLIHHLIRSERYKEAVDVMQSDPTKNYKYEYAQNIDILLKHVGKTDSESSIKLLITKSALLFNLGKIRDAEAVLKQIMHLAVTGKNLKCMGFVYHWICAYDSMTYAFQKAIFTGEKAISYYKAINAHSRTVQDVMRVMALSELFRNEKEASRAIFRDMEALKGKDRHDWNDARAEFHLYTGEYSEAILVISENLGNLTHDDPIRLFMSYDITTKTLWQLCDFTGLKAAAGAMVKLGGTSETLVSQAWAMLAASEAILGDREAADDAFTQAEFFSGQIRNDYDKVDALRTLALAYSYSGKTGEARESAIQGLVLGLRHSMYYSTFTLLTILLELHARKGEREQALFYLREASFFCRTDIYLAFKDMIIYRYWSWKLGGEAADANEKETALKLYAEETARLRSRTAVESMNAIRSFGPIAAEARKTQLRKE